MATIRLKGVNKITKRLADGSRRVYWYFGRGRDAVRLDGAPGTAEFHASYTAALAPSGKPAAAGTLAVLLAGYRAAHFPALADKTRLDYDRHLAAIREKFATLPLAALDDRKVRGVFLKWRDAVGRDNGNRQADYRMAVLAAALAWAADRGMIARNPLERRGRLYKGASRVDQLWTLDHEAMFYAHAPAHLHLALTLALWTGQRQGDLLALPWGAYDGTTIRLRQSKTGKRVAIPVGGPLKVVLDAAARRATIILTTEAGTPWTSDGFRASWRAACHRAGIVGRTFHDLRGSAATRLAEAGCTELEIAAITGHSTSQVRSILDSHYVSKTDVLGRSAIAKLVASQKQSNP